MKRILLLFGLCTILYTSCAKRVVTTTPTQNTRVVVVKKAPRNHKVVVIKGRRYYTWNGNRYRKTRNGYVLVKVR
ncbi:hypothetical protein J1N09_13040 [Aureitalea sp. L0-47]|uniref:hypothetical protein n=1 Tax=Aureitalea sp. L0-47 TaxID=2816962 RepID=UPI00223905CE|nr:hypothetical protein [Aureitalea sp. L0-47]MCW5520767.1 hypothetical protein [Aureitalea sp. L0-47]